MQQNVLKAEGISKHFGGVRAIEDFSLELNYDEVKGIIGPNGAGKTTIFNVLSHIYQPDSGSIHLAGENINNYTQTMVARKGLSRTFQNTRLFSGLSVLDNVKVSLDYAGKYNMVESFFRTPKVRKEEKRIAKEAMNCLEVVNLEKYAEMRPNNLSYGIQRRVEIARALAMKPKVLLLDEPAAGLNPEEVFELIDFIRDIKKNFNLALLIIEHRMDVIMGLCDYIYVQNFGHTIAYGSPEEIQNNKIVQSAYLGEEGCGNGNVENL